jgi:hypothetical protein
MKKAMKKLGTFARLVLWTYAGIAIGSDPAQMMNSQIPPTDTEREVEK